MNMEWRILNKTFQNVRGAMESTSEYIAELSSRIIVANDGQIWWSESSKWNAADTPIENGVFKIRSFFKNDQYDRVGPWPIRVLMKNNENAGLRNIHVDQWQSPIVLPLITNTSTGLKPLK